jgi:protein-disulfide isomerase
MTQGQDDPNTVPVGEPEATERGDSFLRFRRSTFYSVLVPLAFVTGLAVGYLAWGRTEAPPVTQPIPVAGSGAPAPETRVQVETDDDPAIGPEIAPITIVEFSDFNCPFCQRFHNETFTPLLETYPGQIRFVYRDYPITSQESFFAAQASECANEQGKFWEYHDALFSGRMELGTAAYSAYAKELGLDADQLVACVEEGRFAEEVQDDARYAAALGVTGTPTFFINGIPLVGAQPLIRFTQVIDNELQ